MLSVDCPHSRAYKGVDAESQEPFARRYQMKLRLLQLISIAGFIIALSQMMSTVAGQAPTPGQNGPALKTSWGEPDLMGIWTINYQVPLERPDKYKDKAFFTEAEIAELDSE